VVDPKAALVEVLEARAEEIRVRECEVAQRMRSPDPEADLLRGGVSKLIGGSRPPSG